MTQNRDPTVQIYFDQMSETPLLTEEQQDELFSKLSHGDKEAGNKLAKASLRLVIYIAKRYISQLGRNNTLEFKDLIQEGNLALVRAAAGFRQDKDSKFSDYAGAAIERAIWDLLRFERNRSALASYSLDCEVGEEGEDDLKTVVVDESAVCPSVGANYASLKVAVQGAVANLAKDERKILELTYGFADDGAVHTDIEIAKMLGISQPQTVAIRRLHLLRSLSNNKNLKAYHE